MATAYEWRLFGILPPELSAKIQKLQLPLLLEDHFSDEYIWYPSCSLNIKLRDNRLKIKKQQKSISQGVELWSTENSIPFDSFGLSILAQELQIAFPKKLELSRYSFDLNQVLKQFTPPLTCIRVAKSRQKYFCSWNKLPFVLEVTQIQEPEQTYTICLECNGTGSNAIEQAIIQNIQTLSQELNLPETMKARNYVMMLEKWGQNI